MRTTTLQDLHERLNDLIHTRHVISCRASDKTTIEFGHDQQLDLLKNIRKKLQQAGWFVWQISYAWKNEDCDWILFATTDESPRAQNTSEHVERWSIGQNARGFKVEALDNVITTLLQ